MTKYNIDWDFIHNLEAPNGNPSLKAYVPTHNGKPLGNSGITIGYGTDLAHVNSATIWEVDKINTTLADKIFPYCRFNNIKLIGTGAMKYLQRKPLTITIDEAETLFSVKAREIMRELKHHYDKAEPNTEFTNLNKGWQTVLASLAWQYGPNLPARCPKFWRAAIKQDKEAMIAELRDFGDDFPTRRNKEADYLENNG